jgi:hypothetical protein
MAVVRANEAEMKLVLHKEVNFRLIRLYLPDSHIKQFNETVQLFPIFFVN